MICKLENLVEYLLLVGDRREKVDQMHYFRDHGPEMQSGLRERGWSVECLLEQ